MYLKCNLNFDKLVSFTQHGPNVCYSKNCISESLKYIHVRSNTPYNETLVNKHELNL